MWRFGERSQESGKNRLKTSDFYYDLPQELIAQTPLDRRDSSRLMVLDKQTGATRHLHFYDLPTLLRPGDCLVLNDSRVLPARLLGHREPSGGAVEVLLLVDRSVTRQSTPGRWAPPPPPRPGSTLPKSSSSRSGTWG